MRVLVIGGGPAGTFAAIAAKKQDPAATVTLLTREHCEPYEKPPLSKAVLLGSATIADALIAGPAGVAAHEVVLRTRADCTAIDRAVHAVHARHGVDIRVGTMVTSMDREDAGHLAVMTDAGNRFAADLVVVGTGSKPDDGLAAAAGLATSDGIVVDEYCRTSDAAVF